ncbi:hypothetical protein HYO65_gp120 [Tenacibaculum phage PTm1]|uniref:Uncharacterized protein n=2 Tax=Shirahamavirus PTm1 TaxID=2846435 RepID=A0A5S9HY38_9CAUD|nr:hypothetical protein HYO65_gp120 [Tenacibaculum phage PTm1]BBI90512.1 hypothetical protein [Tenacibaculum phage PTm1]BBI90820.1 hypothetical protein [Tenacibaculum phage PTm5]
MAGGRSITETQTNILGQFQKVLRSQVHDDIITQSISRGKKNIKPKQESDARTFERIQTKQALEATKRQMIIDQTAMDRNRHSLLNSVLDIFGIEWLKNQTIDAELMEEFKGKTYTIYNSDKLKVYFEIKQILKYNVKCFIHIEQNKEIFVKADDFETTRRTIKANKVINDSLELKPALGDIFEFRKPY